MDRFFPIPRREYSVGELTAEIGELLTDAYSGIWVRGEISGLKLATSGHAYFTLKDDRAHSTAPLARKSAYRLLKYKPKDGADGHCPRTNRSLRSPRRIPVHRRNHRTGRRLALSRPPSNNSKTN